MKKLKSLEKTDTFFAAFLTVWFVYLFYPFHYTEGGITADGVTYVQIAKNILRDGSLGWQATWTSPFFSVLIAAAYPLFKSFIIACYMVNTLMLWLLPLSVYLLASTMFNKKIGLLAAIFASFHPHFFGGHMDTEPEVTYTTLLVFSVAFSWLAYSRSSLLHSILSGLFFSLTYMTRSEGFMIFGFVLSAIVFLQIKDRKGIRSFTYIAAIVITFALVSFPYLSFLKGTYGKWVLSPKSSYVQIWMKWRIYKDDSLAHYRSEADIPELWGLSENGKLMWQEPKGLGDLVTYLSSNPQKSISVYLHNFLMQIPGRIPNSSGTINFPTVLPIYFAIPALLIFLLRETRRNFGKCLLILSSPFVILFVFPIFTEGWVKYLMPYLPFLVILAVAGLSALIEKFINTKSLQTGLIWTFALVIISYDMRVVKFPPSRNMGDESVRYRRSIAEEQKKAGEWAQKRFKGTPNYMISWSKLAYYLNGRWTAMPVTNYDGMVWYAGKNRVDYLIFESRDGESEEIARNFRNSPDLEVADVYESQDRSYGVVFLRLKE